MLHYPVRTSLNARIRFRSSTIAITAVRDSEMVSGGLEIRPDPHEMAAIRCLQGTNNETRQRTVIDLLNIAIAVHIQI